MLYLTPPAAIAWSAALVGSPASLPALAAIRAGRRRRAVASRVPGATRVAIKMSIGETVHEGRELARALAGPWSPLALAALIAPGVAARRDG